MHLRIRLARGSRSLTPLRTSKNVSRTSRNRPLRSAARFLSSTPPGLTFLCHFSVFAVQYYGAGFDRTYQGLFSPGPATYSPGDRYIGGQSKRKEGPSFSFGSAPRPCTTAVHGKEPSVSPRHYSQRRTPSFSQFAADSSRTALRFPPSAPSTPRATGTSPYGSVKA